MFVTSLFGTPQYDAPEIKQGARLSTTYPQRGDVDTFVLFMYELTAHQPPWSDLRAPLKIQQAALAGGPLSRSLAALRLMISLTTRNSLSLTSECIQYIVLPVRHSALGTLLIAAPKIRSRPIQMPHSLRPFLEGHRLQLLRCGT